MTRIFVLGAAAIGALAACGSDDAGPANAAREPPPTAAANAAAPAPAAADAAPAPDAASPEPAAPRSASRPDIPPAFRGVYDEDRAACSRPSEYRLTVDPRQLRFHESIGEVRSVAVDAPDTIRVDADYQGEGERWRNLHTLRLTDGGATLTITGEGTNLARIRCPAQPTGS